MIIFYQPSPSGSGVGISILFPRTVGSIVSSIFFCIVTQCSQNSVHDGRTCKGRDPLLPQFMITPLTPASATGFSFSPGGLLFPYHLGAITSLEHHGRITDPVHLAGASAGAIAVASYAARTPPARALEAVIRMCGACETQFNGRAVGNLLPLLKIEMDKTLGPDSHTIINEREGVVALAHRELFPNNRPVLTTKFETRDDLIEAVCDSSMFPFFSTPFPARLRYKTGEQLPRVVVDGFFTVPR